MIEVSQWKDMYYCKRVLIVVAAINESLFMIMVTFDGSMMCFREFVILSNISDLLDKSCLVGCVTNIVHPMRWLVLIFFFCALFSSKLKEKSININNLKMIDILFIVDFCQIV